MINNFCSKIVPKNATQGSPDGPDGQVQARTCTNIDLDEVDPLEGITLIVQNNFVHLIVPKNATQGSKDGPVGQVKASTCSHVGLDEVDHLKGITFNVRKNFF